MTANSTPPEADERLTATGLINRAAQMLRESGDVSEEEFAALTAAHHQLFQALKEKAYRADEELPEHDLGWLEGEFVPQSMQFAIDVLPIVQQLLVKNFSRSDTVFLDVGPGSGSGANLIATLHRSAMLGPRLKVDAIDIFPSRRRYASLVYPEVRLEIGDIAAIPDGRQWDIVYCSHTIEHVDDPAAFLRHLLRIAAKYVVVYAPYNETEMIYGHHCRITERIFDGCDIVELRKISSLGWHAARGDLCLLAVLDASGGKAAAR